MLKSYVLIFYIFTTVET